MLNFPTWKKLFVSAVCALGVLYAMPNFFSEGTFEGLPDWGPGKQVNLGLDLRGGAHLLYKVDTEAYIQSRLKDFGAQTQREMRQARIGYKAGKPTAESYKVQLRDPASYDQVREIMAEISQNVQITSTDEGLITVSYPEEIRRTLLQEVIQQSIEVIRRRVDPDGTAEPVIQQQGESRILLQVPGAKDTEAVKTIVGKTAKMDFRMIDQTASPTSGRVPSGSELLNEYRSAGQEGQAPAHRQQYLVETAIGVDGKHLTNAQASFDQNNQPAVSFQFDAVGGARFAKITAENVGRPFAIVLDNEVISAPVIRSAIPGGSGIITGNFTIQETYELALLLRSGALPVDLTVLEERSVGPGLGQDSIDAGKFASIIGLIGVIIYMVLSYGLFGIMANVALVFNMALILAILSGLQATLTLPGIAGIVLTIGMAVDANVLIFERIREEMRNGRTSANAIEAGYNRALTTIIDSNLTTLIAAILLYTFGAGPIKGFAVTLSVGIVTSMFTAIMVTRFFVVTWYMRKRPKALPI